MANGTNPSLTRAEKIFIACFATFTFLVSLGFVITTVSWGLGFPAVFVAVALGICIASIVYAFLGGVAGAQFTVIKGVSLAGTLAAIAIVYYLISDPLQKNMNDVKAIETGKSAESRIQQLEEQVASEQAARMKAEEQAREAAASAGLNKSDNDAAVLAQVRKSTASDRLGRGIIDIYRNHEGPFHSETLQLQSRFLQDVPSGTFRFCHDSKPAFQDKQIQFEIVDPDTGTSRKIQLHAGGDIGAAACQVIKFDVQLGCDAAKALLQVNCDDKRGVAWAAPSDNRIYPLSATVMNPSFD
jgi:hypothetical protein